MPENKSETVGKMTQATQNANLFLSLIKQGLSLIPTSLCSIFAILFGPQYGKKEDSGLLIKGTWLILGQVVISCCYWWGIVWEVRWSQQNVKQCTIWTERGKTGLGSLMWQQHTGLTSFQMQKRKERVHLCNWPLRQRCWEEINRREEVKWLYEVYSSMREILHYLASNHQ